MIFHLIFCLALSLPGQAKEAAKINPATKKIRESIESLSIAKGTHVEVYYYDNKSETFEISISKEPGVGPNVVTPENLYKAAGIKDVDFKTFSKRKSEYVGAEYDLIEKLPLLSPTAVAERKKKLNKF